MRSALVCVRPYVEKICQQTSQSQTLACLGVHGFVHYVQSIRLREGERQALHAFAGQFTFALQGAMRANRVLADLWNVGTQNRLFLAYRVCVPEQARP